MRSLGRVVGLGLLVAAGWAGPGSRAAEEGGAKVLTGECLCGAVKYRVDGPIRECNYCDCRGCQRALGALRTPWVVVPRAALTITQGETRRFRGDQAKYPGCEAHGERAFCPTCGSHLFWYGDRGDTVDLVAGTLDDPSVFQPTEPAAAP